RACAPDRHGVVARCPGSWGWGPGAWFLAGAAPGGPARGVGAVERTEDPRWYVAAVEPRFGRAFGDRGAFAVGGSAGDRGRCTGAAGVVAAHVHLSSYEPGWDSFRLVHALGPAEAFQQPVGDVVGAAGEAVHVPQVAAGVDVLVEAGRVLLVELDTDLPGFLDAEVGPEPGALVVLVHAGA